MQSLLRSTHDGVVAERLNISLVVIDDAGILLKRIGLGNHSLVGFIYCIDSKADSPRSKSAILISSHTIESARASMNVRTAVTSISQSNAATAHHANRPKWKL